MYLSAPPASSLLPRRLSNETHATAQRKQEQMEKLRQAFGLKDVSTTASSVLLGTHQPQLAIIPNSQQPSNPLVPFEP